MNSCYFDHAATTPVDPRVVEAMLPYFDTAFGNSHSIHGLGRRAHEAVEVARGQVAGLLGSDPAELVFTSGATEANNWILRSFPTVCVSEVEHSSIDELSRHLDLFVGTAPGPVDLASSMSINNETGEWVEPVAVEASHWHSDITQQVGKLPVNLESSQLDFASLSGHKFYGPKGIGALYARSGLFPKPLLIGGGQEHGFRAGTLNVPAIVGMGKAAEIAQDRLEDDLTHVSGLRAIVLETLNVSDWQVNADGSPYILSLSFAGLEAEALVIDLDRQGFAISSGAACSSGSTEPSHVLLAMGIPAAFIRGTVRISFGRQNTQESARDLGLSLQHAVESLRSIHQ